MAMAIRLILADDHALFRDGLKSLLKYEADIAVVGEADRLHHVMALIESTAADVLLLDLQMDKSSLLEIERLAQRISVIVVTASELMGDALAAMRLGARAVVMKRFAVETLMDAIRSVVAGNVWLPANVQEELVTRLRGSANEGPLTPREEEIVRHIALGLRNDEVGKLLFISEQTVKTHLSNIFQKLGIHDRTELTIHAIRTGIISVHERP
jgi:DNA-binding NarL/FixJ family response regulator